MKAITTILLAGLALPAIGAIGVPEPETIFYGKVVNRSGPQPYQMSSGTLQWSISSDGGPPIEFTAELSPLADGTYSYRLPLPHSALALDLEADPESIPLGASESYHEHLTITVNGFPATIAEPGSHSFDLAQATRAATYRLDLDVTFALPDSDGDDIPDWWEDEHGLDKQLNDAAGDPDGDGLGNLAEFLAGSDPNADNRIPTILTTSVKATAEGISGIYLTSVDSDSSPTQLIYTLDTLPEHGTLALRDPSVSMPSPDTPLGAGDSFSQSDIHLGKLIYRAAPGNTATEARFALSLSDEDPEHESGTGEITIVLDRPTSTLLESRTPAELVELALSPQPLPGVGLDDNLRLRQFILASHGNHLIWDLVDTALPVNLALPSSAQDPDELALLPNSPRNAMLVGSSGPDTISGGPANDLLIGGPGDDLLAGAGGSDRFIITAVSDGSDTIADFSLEQDDRIDLTSLLGGESTLLSDYVLVTSASPDLTLALDTNGDGSGFTDISITLTGAEAPGLDLYTLWSGGHLLADGLSLPPRVALTASDEHASENGPTPSGFTITLGSPSASPLLLNLQVSGSATNGVDYELLPSQWTVPAGLTQVEIPINPYIDATTELTEVVQLSVTAGDGYELTSASTAQVSIDDLMPEITLSTLVPNAYRNNATQGLILLTRSAIIDRSVLVRLSLSGTATNGSDYTSIITFVNLPSGETTALIPVIPLAGGTLQHGSESVRLSIIDDASYRVGDPDAAEVIISESLTTLADWQTEHFPELAGGSLSDFAETDSDDRGMANILRYAHHLSPGSPFLDSSHLPVPRIVDDHLAIEFTRRLDATDLVFTIESSADLATWSTEPSALEDLSHTLETTDARRRLFRLKEPIDSNPLRFLRVRVDFKP